MLSPLEEHPCRLRTALAVHGFRLLEEAVHMTIKLVCISLATEILHRLINLLSVYVVIAQQKAARNRQSRRHPSEVVHDRVRYAEYRVQSEDNLTRQRRTFVLA
jgi:hypothetical protein